MSKKEWGNATWYLFHTLAEKIDEKYYLENKKTFFKIIELICTHLPCPTCAEDSINLLKNANINAISSKETLKLFFFEFHNKVNHKLGKQIFEQDILSKYKLARTQNIIINFLNKYFVHQYNEKLMIFNYNKSQIEGTLKSYLYALMQNGWVQI
jgi:hypothetical protein